MPARRAAIVWAPVPPPDPLRALREPNGGDLQFGAAQRRAAARGGCRRGWRGLPRACNSQQRRGGERKGRGTVTRGDGHGGRERQAHGRSLCPPGPRPLDRRYFWRSTLRFLYVLTLLLLFIVS